MTPGTLIAGRFEIEREVAAGGMGILHRAHDHLDGVPVAVKVLRGAELTEILRFERECTVLAELHHPGIVRHIAHGLTIAGDRYLVTEWLDGEDLAQRLARRPLTPAESLTILHQAASALTVAHARGWVHRDLKPGNIFLVGVGFGGVKLLDFGIVRLLDGSAPLGGAGALLGTPGYMAPEQARGLSTADARADVFSLGCVLFECLSGRRAFLGTNVVALLAEAEVHEVSSVRRLRPELPSSLEHLVRRMMARSPDARLGDAAAIVRALDALGEDGAVPAPVEPGAALTMGEQRVVGLGRPGARELSDRAGSAVLAAREASLLLGKPSPFVGRAGELSLLEARFSACVDRRLATAVVVIGAAGSGKSRLRSELVERLGRVPVTVLTGRADSLGEGAPFGIVADAIREAAGVRGDEPLEARRGALIRRLGRDLEGEGLARVSAFLGEMAGIPFPDDHHPTLRTARGNAQLMGDAMRAAWEEWLAASCAARPVLLVLEDLHRGDLATVRLVDATLRNLGELPLFVLALARGELRARFPGLWDARGARELELLPLAREASVELVRGALGVASEPHVQRLVERAAGNPFYLEELVRAVAAGREALPDSVLGTVAARLDAEGMEAKRVLRAASVFGQRFTSRGVAELLGGADRLEQVRDWMAELVARELLVAPGPPALGDVPHAFRQALVREAVYATLTEQDRALGHRLAGAWLAASGSTDAVALAEHFRRGGEPGHAVRWFRRAAQQALAADDLAAALDRVARGTACGAAGDELAALRLVEAEARLWLGELGLAEQRGIEAAALFRPGSEGWFRSRYQEVVASGKLGHVDRVERSFSSTRAVVADEGALGAQISYLCACASTLSFGGSYVAADATHDALAPLAPPDALSIALLAQTRSFRAAAQGDSVACLEELTVAFAAFEGAGDRRNACSTRVNLGFVLAELGAFEGAEQALRAALDLAERLGLQELAAVARNNLGHALCCRGELDEARRLLRRSIETLHRQRASRDTGLAHIYLAETERRAGCGVAAEREARAAAGLLRAIPQLHASALAALACALLDQRRVPEALETAGEAHAQLAALGSVEEGEATIRLVYAEALAAAGRAPEFLVAIAEAAGSLLARAAKISDGAWRARFLSCVPDHARTLALAALARGEAS